MTSPGARRAILVTHIAGSAGWMGAVAAFIVLAVIGLTDANPATVRGVYLVMAPAADLVLVPLALVSLLTGVVQSLTGAWGLLRHYWVMFKLLINLFATAVLLLYRETFAVMAHTAADPAAPLDAVRNPSPLLHAVAAFGVLSVALVLSVYKPRGLTSWGRRVRRSREVIGLR